jgi:D-methionine transport system ATP-binding protein
VTTQLRIDQISFAAGKFAKGGTIPRSAYLLRNLSFEIAQGDRITLLGASGAGKTTLLRLLCRLDDPVQGAIYLNGQAFSSLPVMELRRQILFVPQEPKLLGMTVREALLYPLNLRNLRQSEAEQRVNEWCDRIQIPRDWLNRTELQLSLGERQLVALTRALICQAPILLLDEPTAALDAGHRDRILEVISGLSGHTILMATHQLDLAAQFSQRVLYLERGELAEDGNRDRIDWQNLETAIAKIAAEEAAEWD